MEPLTRVCTPACGQPNGGRAGVPSGYTLVLSTSIHYSKISTCTVTGEFKPAPSPRKSRTFQIPLNIYV